jgi:hypothetical protein
MSQRARAELKRAEYFSQIAKQELKGDDPNHEADLLRLEYFRRYQLGIQLNFYNGRSKDHARDARQALAISSFAIAGASLVTALSGTALSSYAHGKFTALAAFGAAFTALASFATVRESVFQYQRNADRYEKTGEILGGMLATMDEVREAVRQAGQPPLLEFVNAVQEQLSLEHRQWLGAADEQNKALEQLKANLADVMKKAAEKKDEKAKGQTPPAST